MNWNDKGIILLKLTEFQIETVNDKQKENKVEHDPININLKVFLNGSKSFNKRIVHQNVK